MNVLSLTGYVVDTIVFVEPYNQVFFGNAMTQSSEGNSQLKRVWQKIIEALGASLSQIPLSRNTLMAAATSLSFGLDENTDPSNESHLLNNFLLICESFSTAKLTRSTYHQTSPTKQRMQMDRHLENLCGISTTLNQHFLRQSAASLDALRLRMSLEILFVSLLRAHIH